MNALDEYLVELKAFAHWSREEFLGDPHRHHLAERFLHLACECVLDISQHVISDMGFRQPEDYKDSMEVLRQEGILGDDLAKRLKGWMGFRNVLVHLYLAIDHNQSYDTIHNELGDLEDFKKNMAQLLRS
ncbi:MAG: DUF86 domain-containing protein [bacterium]|nr:DUF86 domain-containing protein [bacterium]